MFYNKPYKIDSRNNEMVKFGPFGLLFSSMFIDILTLIIVIPYKLIKGIFSPPKKINPEIRKKYSNVAIIIPAYNEEQNIARSVSTAFNQTVPPKKVIIIDDCSTDNTYEICKQLKKQYHNLILLRKRKNSGKASIVRYALMKHVNEEITIILDSDTFLAKNFIEEITKPFFNERVVMSTGISLPAKQDNFFGKIIVHGSVFQYKFFVFRKKAQGYRNAISVVCGDSSAYRTSFLKGVGGLPKGTVTEDMDITWIALEQGYRVAFQGRARAVGKDASTFKGHWKQVTRWYSGGYQCLFKHGRDLTKSKPLLFTTLIPVYIDSILYSTTFLLAPLIFFIYPALTIGFYTVDFLFTVLAIVLIDIKSLIYLPQIYFLKFMWSSAWVYASIKTTFEYLRGKRSWTGRWVRDGYYVKNKNLK